MNLRVYLSDSFPVLYSPSAPNFLGVSHWRHCLQAPMTLVLTSITITISHTALMGRSKNTIASPPAEPIACLTRISNMGSRTSPKIMGTLGIFARRNSTPGLKPGHPEDSTWSPIRWRPFKVEGGRPACLDATGWWRVWVRSVSRFVYGLRFLPSV